MDKYVLPKMIQRTLPKPQNEIENFWPCRYRVLTPWPKIQHTFPKPQKQNKIKNMFLPTPVLETATKHFNTLFCCLTVFMFSTNDSNNKWWFSFIHKICLMIFLLTFHLRVLHLPNHEQLPDPRLSWLDDNYLVGLLQQPEVSYLVRSCKYRLNPS